MSGHRGTPGSGGAPSPVPLNDPWEKAWPTKPRKPKPKIARGHVRFITLPNTPQRKPDQGFAVCIDCGDTIEIVAAFAAYRLGEEYVHSCGRILVPARKA